MNNHLKKIAFLTGMGILFVSMYWSQDGFNFEIAGDSGYATEAIAIGWFLALAVTVIQFVFSSNFYGLNMSLIVIGAIAYAYSIDTNITGILHFMGKEQDIWWARGLGFLMDATAEPLIAWSLGVGRDGDFLGNIVKTIVAFFNGIFDGAKSNNRGNQPNQPQKREKMPEFKSFGRDSEEIPDFPAFPPMKDRRTGKKPNLHKLQSTAQKRDRFYKDE